MKTPSPQEADKTRELPILFAPDLAQKVHLGLKTETRRLVKPQPVLRDGDWFWKDQFGNATIRFRDDGQGSFCLPNHALYQPGDLLYVRETFALDVAEGPGSTPDGPICQEAIVYRGAGDEGIYKWTPSIHMPKWAARTWLEVLSVSVERVAEISYGAALAEGYERVHHFSDSWIKRYPGTWDANAWVWVIKFKKVEAPNGRA